MISAQSLFFNILQRIDPKTKALSSFSQVANQVGYQDSSQTLVISAATNVNPVKCTVVGHGYVTGDPAYISGCTTNTAPNNTAAIPYWPVTVIDADNFTIPVAGNGVYDANSGRVTKALVGSVDGAKFVRQRQLEIYNFARRTLLRTMIDLWKDNTARVMNEIGATIVTKTDLAFVGSTWYAPGKYLTGAGSWTAVTGYLTAVMSANFDVTDVGKLIVFSWGGGASYIYGGTIKQLISTTVVRVEGNVPAGNLSTLTYAMMLNNAAGGDTIASVPNDYIEFVSMIDGASANAKKNSINLADPKFEQTVLKGYDPEYVQLAARRFIFLKGSTFFNPGGFVQAGATYILNYYGLTDFTLADILGNTTLEAIPFPRHAALIELAQAIADEKSIKEINELAALLIGKGQ